MRNIYKDEKDLLLVIEKEKVSLFKNTGKKWSYGVLGRRNNMHIKDTYGK